MIKKLIVILITTFTLTLNVNASSDGELILKKNSPSDIEDCWEGFNRASFALNQGLDKVVFKPIANVYRTLPSPVKNGISNSLSSDAMSIILELTAALLFTEEILPS